MCLMGPGRGEREYYDTLGVKCQGNIFALTCSIIQHFHKVSFVDLLLLLSSFFDFLIAKCY